MSAPRLSEWFWTLLSLEICLACYDDSNHRGHASTSNAGYDSANDDLLQ